MVSPIRRVEQPNQALQADDEARVERSQQAGEQAVNQRLVDEGIDVPQPRAQNGNGEKNGDKREGHAENWIQIPQHRVILDG